LDPRADWEQGWTVRQEGAWAVARMLPRPPCAACGDTGRRAVELDGAVRFGRCRCQMLPDRVALFNAAAIPARHAPCTMDSFVTTERGTAGPTPAAAAWSAVRAWLDDYRPGGDNRGLVLYGEPGRGKTHLAVAACRELVFRLGVAVRFVEFSHLVADIRDAIGRGDPDRTTLTPYVTPPVLVIDELGKGRNTDWESSVLDELVSRRYNARGALLGTTNFPLRATAARRPGIAEPPAATLPERLGDRVFSRLRETVTWVHTAGEDHRVPSSRH
jgi:DNA replication protein DnaC